MHKIIFHKLKNLPNHYFLLCCFILCLSTISCKKQQLSDASFIPSKGIHYTFADTLSRLTVTFSDDSKDVSKYFWDFGDGTTSSQPNPTHTYVDSGRTKQYKITRVAVGPAGYKDTLIDELEVYSAIPSIYSSKIYAFSQNGEYVLNHYSGDFQTQFATKIDMYLITDNAPTLKKVTTPTQSGYQQGYYNDYNQAVVDVIGNFDEATVSKSYKIKIVATGSTGKVKDTTIDIVPRVTNARPLVAQLWNMPSGWALGSKIDLAMTAAQLEKLVPSNIRTGYTTAQNCSPWGLDSLSLNGLRLRLFGAMNDNATDQRDFRDIRINPNTIPTTAKMFDRSEKIIQGYKNDNSVDMDAQLKVVYQYE